MSIRNDIFTAAFETLRSLKDMTFAGSTVSYVGYWNPQRVGATETPSPAVYFYDLGVQNVLVEDSTHIRLGANFMIAVQVRDQSTETRHAVLNAILDEIRDRIKTGLSLGDYCLATQWQFSDPFSIDSGIAHQATAGIILSPVYYVDRPVTAEVGASSVSGEDWANDTRDLIVALFEALVTSMATADVQPRIGYVHDTHQKAALRLPAVTVGLIGDTIGLGLERAAHLLAFSVRVHTDYIGGYQDELVQSQLVTSVVNKLLVNMRLSTAHQIAGVSDIRTGMSFDDSGTYGAEFVVTVTVLTLHEQETT